MTRLHSENILVLNKYFLAVQIVSAKKAIIALYTNKARVVDQNYGVYSFEEWRDNPAIIPELYPGTVSSPSVTIYIPQVIQEPRNTLAFSIFRSPKFSRKNIFQRDHYRCQYCGDSGDSKTLTRDHIIPKARGGDNSWENLVACCLPCNNIKGDKLLEELGWTLLSKPVEPIWNTHINKSINEVKKTYWKTFLS